MIRVDRDEIVRAVRLLYQRGDVIELRAPKTIKGTVSGYFDNGTDLVAAAAELSGEVPGVYVTINPVQPALRARAANRVERYARTTAGDVDVVTRRWLPLDFDPQRPAGIGSTEAEHTAALTCAREAREWLVAFGFPADSLVLADSGNGAHVLIRIDLPNDDASTRLVQRCIEAAALHCGAPTIAIDSTVHNAARIWKLYGTLACKGDSVPERPHRLARILDAPSTVTVTSRELLDRLAATLPVDDEPARTNGRMGDFDVRDWLARHGLGIRREKPWRNGATVLELATCPFNAEHNHGEAAVIVEPSGRLLYACRHNSCQGKRWSDVRERFDGPRIAPRVQAPQNEPPKQMGPTNPTAQASGFWARAKPVDSFIDEVTPEAEFLVPHLLAKGCLTILHSPRGLGKTHVAHALAVGLARAGVRVLLLDRDNPPTTTRKWLRAWGASGLETLHILSRGEVPSLMTADKWTNFPPAAFDVVILDALDSATEGAGEQNSDRISRALAPLLDLAHRDGGPAVLVLSNTVKAGTQGRGSGVIEDRADIVYEVRDATGFTPSGKSAWFRELPSADRAEWADRAERRTQRQQHRLAFVPSKFRVGEEPAPFAFEVDRTTEPWSLRDVTADLDAAGCEARAAEEQRKTQAAEAAVGRLAAEVLRRAGVGETPLNHGEAITILRGGDGSRISRDLARTLLDRENGARWRQDKDRSRKGHPTVVLGVNQEWPAADKAPHEKPHQSGLFEAPLSAVPAAQGPQIRALGKPLNHKGFPVPPLSAAVLPERPPHGPPDGNKGSLGEFLRDAKHVWVEDTFEP